MWNVENEIVLFHGMELYKPVGIHKHIRMYNLFQYFNKHASQPVATCQELWDKVHELYNLSVLDEMELKEEFGGATENDGLLFFNEFSLPEAYFNANDGKGENSNDPLKSGEDAPTSSSHLLLRPEDQNDRKSSSSSISKENDDDDDGDDDLTGNDVTENDIVEGGVGSAEIDDDDDDDDEGDAEGEDDEDDNNEDDEFDDFESASNDGSGLKKSQKRKGKEFFITDSFLIIPSAVASRAKRTSKTPVKAAAKAKKSSTTSNTPAAKSKSESTRNGSPAPQSTNKRKRTTRSSFTESQKKLKEK